MAEPNSTGGAIVIFSAGTVGAFFFDLGQGLGVAWALVFWASLGGYFGLPHAPQEGRIRANITYGCSIFAAAKLASAAAEGFFASNQNYAGALALFCGWGFHLILALGLRLLQEGVARTPEIMQALLARLRGAAVKPPPKGGKK
jgi:hypothetical protein